MERRKPLPSHRDPWNRASGLTVEGLDQPIERPEPPDRTGARI